ncbi:hypothetical protein CDAR_437881 [Caerostris darwini]|uniref:Uncharacterized protein n=1 Tax=Caerostris darwini TaxID=1538125 RepID=A0AAV4NW68_9ARAC|nr:hypothetical protein CDAR_437881 [Caerostris darwini]
MGKLVCAIFLAAVVMQANAWSVFHPIDGIGSLFRDVKSYVRDVNQWFRDGIINRISHFGNLISHVKSRVADLGKNVISHVVNIFHWPHFGKYEI